MYCKSMGWIKLKIQMLTGGLWILKFLGGLHNDILKVGPYPFKWTDTKKTSHTHKKCSKKGLVKGKIS